MRTLWIFVGIGALGLLGAIYTPDPNEKPLQGVATIIDGDTLRLGGQRIRLTGIDAPERAQTCTDDAGFSYPCGAEATRFLSGLINHQIVSCSDEGIDRYGRTRGVCHAGTINLNKEMVRQGWAVAAYGNAYVTEQVVASVSGRGLWAGDFQYPADYRNNR